MKRRDFLTITSGTMLALAVQPRLSSASPASEAASWHKARKFVDLPSSRVAYVEKGEGPAALFIHGWSLNGYQWRGALDRLRTQRRCIAPDMMSMGWTETPDTQEISPASQAAMLGQLLDKLRIDTVDLVGNDSGGLTAQLFLAKYPARVRSLLLTNCDVDENSPPPQFLPFIEKARQGTLVDEFVVPQANDKARARSAQGVGAFYTHPEHIADETIEIYFRPFADSKLKRTQLNKFSVAMATNPLVAIRNDLKQWKGPARMVWGTKDPLFGVQWAEWLDRTLPGSRGIRRIEGANLFFPEEMPELIAEEAQRLWQEKADASS
jgi:pimeloyl-ACP methyl ester carboxylesterase